jgi:four helix bundle protein
VIGGQLDGAWIAIKLTAMNKNAMGLLHYRQLIAWQKSMKLVGTVYELSKRFPKEEIYGLTSQVRRAAISVPSNIAEGQGRNSSREFLHHLAIAYGSLMEVETQILIAESLGYLERTVVLDFLERSAETGRIVNGLMRSLRQRSDH